MIATRSLIGDASAFDRATVWVRAYNAPGRRALLIFTLSGDDLLTAPFQDFRNYKYLYTYSGMITFKYAENSVIYKEHVYAIDYFFFQRVVRTCFDNPKAVAE